MSAARPKSGTTARPGLGHAPHDGDHGHPAHDHLDHPTHAPVADEADERQALLEAAFVEGFRAAGDKTSFLRLAGVPFELTIDGKAGFKLMEVRLCDHATVGAATPGFGTGELVYQPFPGPLVRQHTHLTFIYCGARETRALSWRQVAAASAADGAP